MFVAIGAWWYVVVVLKCVSFTVLACRCVCVCMCVRGGRQRLLFDSCKIQRRAAKLYSQWPAAIMNFDLFADPPLFIIVNDRKCKILLHSTSIHASSYPEDHSYTINHHRPPLTSSVTLVHLATIANINIYFIILLFLSEANMPRGISKRQLERSSYQFIRGGGGGGGGGGQGWTFPPKCSASLNKFCRIMTSSSMIYNNCVTRSTVMH